VQACRTWAAIRNLPVFILYCDFGTACWRAPIATIAIDRGSGLAGADEAWPTVFSDCH